MSAALRGFTWSLGAGVCLLCAGCSGVDTGCAVLGGVLLLTGLAGCRNVRGTPDTGAGACVPCCGATPDEEHCGGRACWCPATWSCNYAWGCIDGGPPVVEEHCCALDADGRIGTLVACLCPGHVACGYTFLDCGGGICAAPDAGGCPSDAGVAVDAPAADAPDGGDPIDAGAGDGAL